MSGCKDEGGEESSAGIHRPLYGRDGEDKQIVSFLVSSLPSASSCVTLEASLLKKSQKVKFSETNKRLVTEECMT